MERGLEAGERRQAEGEGEGEGLGTGEGVTLGRGQVRKLVGDESAVGNCEERRKGVRRREDERTLE